MPWSSRPSVGGVDQVVILGAGYDDRPLRFRTVGVHFFEVDHPSTQADKAGRLRGMGADVADVTLAPSDFRVDDVADVLAGSGHVADRPSLFVAEGLLVYLDEETITGLLAGLRSRAAPASALVATLAVHADGLDPVRVRERANAARLRPGPEPWRTILPAGRQLRLFGDAGWAVDRSVDDATVEAGAAPGRSLTVVAEPQARPRPPAGYTGA